MLNETQIAILKKCREYKGGFVPALYFQGKRYLFTNIEQREELMVDGPLIKQLIDDGLLVESAKSGETFKLTPKGIEALDQILANEKKNQGNKEV